MTRVATCGVLGVVAAAMCVGGGCLWRSSLGEVEATDAGLTPAALEDFGAQLLGRWEGSAGGAARVTQTFYADGGFEGTCEPGDSQLLAGFCAGIAGAGTYQLIALEASGAADAQLTLGDGAPSLLYGMRFSDRARSLTYLAVQASSEFAAELRDAGVDVPTSGARSYIELTRAVR